MADTVNVPKLGPVNKKMLIGIAVAAGGIVVWRYYQASQAPVDDTATAEDTGYEDAGTIPSVAGAVSDDNSYGYGDTEDTDTSAFTTNAQWSNYVSTYLTQSESWSFNDIASALGNYLGSKALTTTQQQIVQAAIAYGGYPPVGSFAIISGGNADMTVAPTGVRVTSTTSTEANLSWNSVAGAEGYRIYRSGDSAVAGYANSNSGKVGGLSPNTSYTFYVAASTSAGKIGPKSAGAKGKTKSVSLAKPNKPHAETISTTSTKLATNKVTGATGYRWYLGAVDRGSSDNPEKTITGLSPGKKYTVYVAADNATQAPGPKSVGYTFTTKKK